MKRSLSRTLALALCLCLASVPALATNAEVLPEYEDEGFRSVDEMVTVGDTVYILTTRSDEMQLWRWKRDMAQAELVTDKISNARYPDEPEEGMVQLSAIFTDRETLYALNHRDSTVYQVNVTDDGITLERAVELGNIGPMCRDPEDWNSFVTPLQTLVVGDKLLWLSTNMHSSAYRTQVLVYDLEDGYVKEAVAENVRTMTPYKDGQALLLCSTNDKSYTVYAYNPETDAMLLLGQTGVIGYVDDVVYDPALDMLLYHDSTRIMGWNPDGARRQVSFVPAVAKGDLTLVEDTIVYSGGSTVVARTVQADYADIPTSLTELCAFATRWNNEFVDKYPQYTLLNNTEEYRSRFLEEMLNANLQQTDPEKSEYKQALIWTGCKVVANWATYMEEFSDRIFIPLSLTPDTPYIAAVENVRIWAVNAKSESSEYAAAMLTERIGALDTMQAHVLQSTVTEPVVSPYYEQYLAEELEYIERLEAGMEDSVNPAAVEQRIAERQAYIDGELKQRMYEVTPSAIENYVSVIVPAMYIRMEDPLTGNTRDASIANRIARYAAGTLSMEAFIDDLEALLNPQN